MSRLTILGAGESGVGAALLAQAQGFDVFVSSIHSIAPYYKAQLTNHNISFEEGRHTAAAVLQADEIVKSPGIPNTVPVVLQAREAGIPIIDEIVLASRYTRAPIVGITGTNGKTTTAHLLHHTLCASGTSAELVGNMGKSFAKAVLQTSPACWVLELSSFQLENSQGFAPHIAVVLNVTPDHLDRYEGSFERYIAAKLTWLGHLQASDHVIYVQDGPVLAQHIQTYCTHATLHPIRLEAIGQTERHLLASYRLLGDHNLQNALTAIEAARLLGVEISGIAQGISSFKGIAHRMERIDVIRSVTYCNDSKATNVEAARAALEACVAPIVWIAGGVDKGNDYAGLLSIVRQKVRALICLGRHNETLLRFFQNELHDVYSTDHMQEAVDTAYRLAQAGDTVLLSPACASFDLFENFADRGDRFKTAVQQLKQRLRP